MSSARALRSKVSAGVARRLELTLRGGFVLFLLLLAITRQIDVITSLAGGVLATAVDLRNLMSLRNYFIAYVTTLFGLGAAHFNPGNPLMMTDLVIYSFVFLGCY